MPFYFVQGRLGSGKSQSVVARIQEALLAGKRVATNLNLKLEHLLPARRRNVDVIRIPDKPTLEHLEALGCGNPTMFNADGTESDIYDEGRNGLLVVDELSSWCNARQWGDKGRAAVIDWLVHSRKAGWDVYFLAPHVNMVDKQIRESLVEFLVHCRRFDRMKIPFLGGLLKLVSFGLIKGTLPQIHLAIVRYGTDQHAIVADRWLHFGTSLYRAYETRQKFTESYPHGAFSYLSPWHLRGRYEPSFLDRFAQALKPRVRAARGPSSRLAPLMQLPPDLRWQAAQHLVQVGAL